MTVITEGRIQYEFGRDWQAQKYDEWSFYRKQFIKIPDTKAVDIIAMGPNKVLYLIEIKDYRQQERESYKDLPVRIAQKMRDSLAGLLAARANANDNEQRDFSCHATAASEIRVVFHMEQYQVASRLQPRKRNSANIQQKLRQLVKAVDARACVYESSDLQGEFGWAVTDIRK